MELNWRRLGEPTDGERHGVPSYAGDLPRCAREEEGYIGRKVARKIDMPD